LQWPPGLRPHNKRGGNIGAKSRELSLGRPFQKPGLASPANVSKRGLSARLFAPQQTPIVVNVRLPKGISVEEIAGGEGLKAARKPPFQGQRATARLLSHTGGSVRHQA